MSNLFVVDDDDAKLVHVFFGGFWVDTLFLASIAAKITPRIWIEDDGMQTTPYGVLQMPEPQSRITNPRRVNHKNRPP